jgi:hypothetical protein
MNASKGNALSNLPQRILSVDDSGTVPAYKPTYEAAILPASRTPLPL